MLTFEQYITRLTLRRFIFWLIVIRQLCGNAKQVCVLIRP